METTHRFILRIAGLVAVLGLASPVALGAAPAEAPGEVTFTKDIAPILQRSCQHCHRPDSVAPMSFLTFGYMNANWDEEIDVPIGPENNIAPGGPDRGQPTHFLPRRNMFLFQVRALADTGDQELVWTLTTHGKTERVYASLRSDSWSPDRRSRPRWGRTAGS